MRVRDVDEVMLLICQPVVSKSSAPDTCLAGLNSVPVRYDLSHIVVEVDGLLVVVSQLDADVGMTMVARLQKLAVEEVKLLSAEIGDAVLEGAVHVEVMLLEEHDRADREADIAVNSLGQLLICEELANKRGCKQEAEGLRAVFCREWLAHISVVVT